MARLRRGLHGGPLARRVQVLVVVAVACVPASASEGQYWGGASLRVDGWGGTVNLEFENRSSGSADDSFYRSIALGFERAVGTRVKLGVCYSHIQTRGSSAWSEEHRPCGDVSFVLRDSDPSVQQRNRLELRLRGEDEALRYRNRLKVGQRLGDTPLTASISDEVFIDLEGFELTRNRTTAGVELRLWQGARAGIFHVYESSKGSGDWEGVHALSLSVAWRIGS